MHTHTYTHIHNDLQRKLSSRRKEFTIEKEDIWNQEIPSYGQRAVAMKAARMNLRITSFFLSVSLPPSLPPFHVSILLFFSPEIIFTVNCFRHYTWSLTSIPT